MEMLSIHERINIKDNSKSCIRRSFTALSGTYERVLSSKNAPYSKGAILICDTPYNSYEVESFRKIDSRFDEGGNLIHEWLLNHPEVHHLIFLL